MNRVFRNRYFRIISFVVVGLMTSLFIGGFLFESVNAQEASSRKFVYVESNIPTENANTILGFSINANGDLTPLPNSPFPTNGTGIADPTYTTVGVALLSAVSDQNLIIDREHRRLFATNFGSNTIAVFNIKEDGSLSPVEGSPFPSGGVDPNSLTLANNLLYVSNGNLDRNNPTQDAADSQPNYTGFQVTPKGRLIPISNSTVSLPNGSLPTQVLIPKDKRILFGVEFRGGLLHSFKILQNGRLEESPNSPQRLPASEFPPGSPAAFPLGLRVHPKLPILYVGFVTINQVGVYSYNPVTGELTFIKAVPNSGRQVCWLITNRKGTRLYTSNTNDHSLSVYDLTDPTTPQEIQHVILNGVDSSAAIELALNSDESLLQAITRRNSANSLDGNGIHVLRVDPQDGTLTELNTSPHPVESVDGSFPQGVVNINLSKNPL